MSDPAAGLGRWAPLRASRAVLVLAVLWCAYPLVPQGPVRSWGYELFAAACVVVGLRGAGRLKGRVRRNWLLVLVGFAGWVVGDSVFTVEQQIVHVSFYPVPSDAFYLSSYVVLGYGLARLLRTGTIKKDPTPYLDAAIITVGSGIVAAAFFIAPVLRDSTLSIPGRVVASAYPMADVMLLGMMASLWAVSGLRSGAFQLLFLGLSATYVADIAWNVIALHDPEADTPAWLDLLFLLGYLAAAAAACSPSAAQIARPRPREETAEAGAGRLVALGCSLALPGVTLLADALTRRQVPWQIVSVGSVILSILVVLRIGLLLQTVQIQAVRLSALARNDALTGAPNRRTWDLELGRAMQQAREDDTALCIAILDLDHFKLYNDNFGHQAGDRLLREAVAAWSAALAPGELIARYGGEEFGLILPGLDGEQAAQRMQQLLALTPDGQSFSAGVAVAVRDLGPDAVVALADRALYEAKSAGRCCVRVADSTCGQEALPPVRIAVESIVDLDTGECIGLEARSHFYEGSPESIFTAAHREGYGVELEVAALRAALRRRPRDGFLSVGIRPEALCSDAVQAVLSGDLAGLVIELAYETSPLLQDQLADVIEDLKSRGASIAVADWGSGYFDVDRLRRLHADAVTVDCRQLASLSPEDQRAVMGATVRWAHAAGVKVCADGIETTDQRELAAELGFDFAQGPYFEAVPAQA